MISAFNQSLQDLEKAFMLNSKEVFKATGKLKNNFDEVSVFIGKNNSLDQNELNTATKLLEKLSIQNDYKLALLKDFPEYLSHKK